MSRNYSQAPDQRDFSELVPHGTLCVGIFRVKPHNVNEGILLTPTKAGTGKYLKADIIIEGGKHDKRHVFTNLNVENPNSVATDIAHGAIKAMLECSRHQVNEVGEPVMPDGAYDLADYGDLDGMKIAFKVSVQSQAGYNDSNDVAVFLSPFQTKKDWDRLLKGEMDPDPNAVIATKKPATVAAAANPQSRWGAPATEQVMPAAVAGQVAAAPAPAAAVAPSSVSQPSWLQNANAGSPTPAPGTPKAG